MKRLDLTIRVGFFCTILNSAEHYSTGLEGSFFQRGSYPFSIIILGFLLKRLVLFNETDETFDAKLLAYLKPLLQDYVSFILNLAIIVVMSEETIFLSQRTY